MRTGLQGPHINLIGLKGSENLGTGYKGYENEFKGCEKLFEEFKGYENLSQSGKGSEKFWSKPEYDSDRVSGLKNGQPLSRAIKASILSLSHITILHV